MDKFYSFLGLCQKAGKLISGEVSCEKGIRSGTVFLVLLAEDASANTKKKFENSTLHYNIPLYTVGTKITLGESIGKEERAVLAITEESFATSMIQKIKLLKQ